MWDDQLEGLQQYFPHAYARICNGVGPEFLARILPRLFKRWLKLWVNAELDRVARGHDYRYWIGGGFVEKAAADLEFGAGCLRVAEAHPGWRRYVLAWASWAYLKAVESWAGALAFHWGKRPDLIRDLVALEAKEVAKEKP
jgi:hypothetical protein